MKLLLNVVGCIAVVLGLIGVFVPLLPTTPFLLLASACFMRSSKRMHRWLTQNRMFGEYLRNVETRKGMPVRAKLVTLVLMWASLAASMYLIGHPVGIALLAAVGTGVTFFILRMKTLTDVRREERPNDAG